MKFTVEIYATTGGGTETLLHREDVSSITPLGARKKAKLVLSSWRRRGANRARVVNVKADTIYVFEE